MTIEIVKLNSPLSPAVQEHVLARSQAALARFTTRVGRVLVHLSDVTGTRGEDVACHIEAFMGGRRSVVVIDAVDHDPFVAIDNATTTLKQVVTRQIRRVRLARRSIRRRLR